MAAAFAILSLNLSTDVAGAAGFGVAGAAALGFGVDGAGPVGAVGLGGGGVKGAVGGCLGAAGFGTGVRGGGVGGGGIESLGDAAALAGGALLEAEAELFAAPKRTAAASSIFC